MTPLTITDFTLSTCLGWGRQANYQAMINQRCGLQPASAFAIDDLDGWLGVVPELDEIELPADWSSYACRNNRLAWQTLQQDGFLGSVSEIVNQYGPERIGLFLGTSTSGIRETEIAYALADGDRLPDWYQYENTHNVYSLTRFVKQVLGLAGFSVSISTACSSSAKVFASAERAIAQGLCDAAVVGGVDSLCHTTIYGFNALQLLSSDRCRPFDRHRSGISIGEAGGFAVLEKGRRGELGVLGYGESSDAYHMSSPHPEGEGARRAMEDAIQRAGLQSADIDYLNLHGTGTPANDLAEATAVSRIRASTVSASSTKGYTGHTLGAAGIVEAAFSLLALEYGFVPPNLNLEQTDPEIAIELTPSLEEKSLRYVLSNSFGFGGSNCSLVFGRSE